VRRFQQRLEDPLWELGLGVAVFFAGLAVWFVLWQFAAGFVLLAGIIYLAVGIWFIRVRTPMQRALSIGFFLATLAILAYGVVPSPFDPDTKFPASRYPSHSK